MYMYIKMSSFNCLNYHSLTLLKPLYCSSRLFSPFRLFSSASDKISLMDFVRAVAEKGSGCSESIGIQADNESYSYHQLILSALKVSNLLKNGVLKSGNGDRVGIVAKPSAEFVAGILGTWCNGGVAVPLALSYPETELLHVINDSDISVILSTEDHQQLLKSVAAKANARFSLIPPVSTSTLYGGDSDEILSEIKKSNISKDDDPALILYTSGTTGKPKGVVHTPKSILAQVETLSKAWEYSSTDKFLHCLPLHHVHGLFNALLAPLYAGSMVEFMPKFSVSGVWKRWRESYPKDGEKIDHPVTVFTGVPTIYTRLIQGYETMDPELQAESASAARHLRLMMCGSSALPVPVMQQWEAITGHRLLERYGMTEFVMSISNPLHGMRKGGTVGKPFPGVEAKIVVEDTNGDDDNESNVGELYIKSPSLFKEYWKLTNVTKDSFSDDGFFKTGDAAKVDQDGYYVILGRNNADIMKVGGYKLSALEIEAVLLEHEAIGECCVLGLADKDYGEAVTAIVVPTNAHYKNELNPPLTLQQLTSWAKPKLAPYKLPTRLLLWDSLPRNAMGKVNKKELKKKLAEDGI